MNKIIERELGKVRLADLSNRKNEDGRIVFSIPKFKKSEFTTGKCYKVVIDEFMLDPVRSSVLANNWNSGSTPPSANMTVEVLDISMGKIKVMGVCKNRNGTYSMWEGWLPIDKVRIESEV